MTDTVGSWSAPCKPKAWVFAEFWREVLVRQCTRISGARECLLFFIGVQGWLLSSAEGSVQGESYSDK